VSTLSTNRVRLVAALAGLNLLLVGAGWFLLVSPQRHHQQSAAQQLQQIQQEATRLVGGAATQATHAKQPPIRTAGLYRLAQAMPVTADEPDLLLALDQLGKASNVKVLQVWLQAPAAQIGYVVQPIQLTLDGSYDSIERYVHAMRMLVGMWHGRLFAKGRLLSVQSVAETPDSKGGTETASVLVNAYVFGSVNGVTPTSTDATSTSTTSTSTTDTTTTTGG
jgi:Tfp pilus assembly protein PilO